MWHKVPQNPAHCAFFSQWKTCIFDWITANIEWFQQYKNKQNKQNETNTKNCQIWGGLAYKTKFLLFFA